MPAYDVVEEFKVTEQESCTTALLQNSTILSGSFNPIHKGHVSLLSKAYEKGLQSGDDVTGTVGRGSERFCFEMSLHNADKGFLTDEDSLFARIKQFSQLRSMFGTEIDFAHLVLTKEPLFIGKARLLPRSCFVLGQDTYKRLLDRKYYADSEEALKLALLEFQALETSFVVGCRADNQG